jgi:hypothetical protein
MPRARKRPLPKQDSRLGSALSEQLDHEHRQKKASAAPFDGDGQYLTDVSMPATTTTTIVHKLGRVPRGWLICAVYSATTAGGGNIIEEVDTGVDSKTKRTAESIQLHNVSITPVWIDIWIY